jgi:hypothetical protein
MYRIETSNKELRSISLSKLLHNLEYYYIFYYVAGAKGYPVFLIERKTGSNFNPYYEWGFTDLLVRNANGLSFTFSGSTPEEAIHNASKHRTVLAVHRDHWHEIFVIPK